MNEKEVGREDRRRRYKAILGLWQAENPIKTLKLQALLLTNALLLAAFFHTEGAWGARRAAILALFMAAADVLWLFSIGRTVAFQRLRKAALERVRDEDPADPFLALHAPSERKLPFWGSVPASTYLIGAPAVLAALWTALLVWAIT